MKKLLSLLTAAVMLISCISVSSFSAFANTQATAYAVGLNQTVQLSLDNTQEGKRAWYTFTPQSTGYYEFVLNGKITNAEITTYIYNSANELEGLGIFDDFSTGELVTASKMTAGAVYYFMIDGGSNVFSGTMLLRNHTHNYDDEIVLPGYYDTEFNGMLTMDGGKYLFCTTCGKMKITEKYYYPKKMTLSKTVYTSNGKANKPKVTIKDRKGNVISKSNYKVTYKNNKKAGKATVKLTFNDKKYSGEFTQTFIIKPRQASLTSLSRSGYGKITAKWKKDSEASGYQIQYSTSEKFTKGTTKSVTVKKNSTTSKTISNLSGKKYYVRVRAYKVIDKKNTYGAWSKAKTA